MKKLIYLILFISSFGFGQQIAKLTSTITAQTGTGSYLDVDEDSISTADYLTSDDNETTTWEAKFDPLTDPINNQEFTITFYESQADGNIGASSGGSSSSYSCYLYQGATLIATIFSSQTTTEGAWGLKQQTINSTQVSNITDWTDLRIRFDFVGGGGSPSNRRGVAICFVSMYVSDPIESLTTALNTADATNFGTDNTPTLEFTGTDVVSSNDLEYKVDIMSAYGTTVDSYADSGSTNAMGGTGSCLTGQSFTGNGTRLHSVQFALSKTGSPLGFAIAKLFAHTGTFGTNSTPTGSALAVSSPLDVSTVTGTETMYTFYFDGSYTMTNAVNYCIYITYVGSTTATGLLNVHFDQSSPTHGGNAFRRTPTSGYAQAAWDLRFTVNSETQALLRNSETDAGFVNTVTGGDTHPFNETEKIAFTVQNADYLADGTYYWRVTAKAPSSANRYSFFSSIRSFSISGGSPPSGARRIFTIN